MAHSDPIEWWYWTGHLQDEAGNWHGYQFSLIYLPDIGGGIPLQSVNFAITDIARQEFLFTESHVFLKPVNKPDSISLDVNDLSAHGKNGTDYLTGKVASYALDLTLISQKPPVFQYTVGYIDYPFGGNTYYYSRERMKTTGTLKRNNETLTVEGTSWFDHQWGDQAANGGKIVGWDWFAIQLDDWREIMVFRLRDAEGNAVFGGGSYTDELCHTTELAATDFTLNSSGTWESQAKSGCFYPSGWSVSVQGMTLNLTAAVDEQELNIPGTAPYWEGAATVSGSAQGRAYIEMTGYCHAN